MICRAINDFESLEWCNKLSQETIVSKARHRKGWAELIRVLLGKGEESVGVYIYAEAMNGQASGGVEDN